MEFGGGLHTEAARKREPDDGQGEIDSSFLNYPAWLELEEKIKTRAASGDDEAREDLQFLKKASLSFGNYVYQVVAERTETRLAYGVLKDAELRQLVSSADQARTAAHEQAIVNVRILNRMASAYGAGRIFLGDESERREIGRFCIEYCNLLFNRRYD